MSVCGIVSTMKGVIGAASMVCCAQWGVHTMTALHQNQHTHTTYQRWLAAGSSSDETFHTQTDSDDSKLFLSFCDSVLQCNNATLSCPYLLHHFRGFNTLFENKQLKQLNSAHDYSDFWGFSCFTVTSISECCCAQVIILENKKCTGLSLKHA